MTENSANGCSFLLEIGTEDMPARFIPPALLQMEENAKAIMTENHIRCSEIRTYGTPRRLVLIVEGIPPMQEDRKKEVFGPSKKVAFDEKGNPTKAAVGFARSQGISVESLTIGKKEKGEYVMAFIEEKGLQVRDILPEISREIVLSIHLPKSMRWGDKSMRFVRPIRWFMSLFDKEPITFEIDGIVSSNMTRGHRFLSPAAFQLKEIPSYKKLLANNYVVVDHEERKKIILAKSDSLLASSGKKLIEDEELLATVANLVEYPVPVLGTFSEEYLVLPEELLITVMKDHQKYFAVADSEGRIANDFIVVSNTSEENSDTVRIGAERVIKARFEDARFYFEEDSKKKLSERIEELRKVTFQENLGSMYEKTQRIAFIAEYLAANFLPAGKDRIARAAQLAKTDLITGVVREFPELQGIIGRYYALHDGEDREVADALQDQYLPMHAGGRLPQSKEGALLSVADKIDNIVSFFSIGLTPTGSEDPFAHRRQALAIVAVLLGRDYRVPLKPLIDRALAALPDLKDAAGTGEKVCRFFENRLETVFSDLGYDSDLIQSVLPLSLAVDLGASRERMEAIRRSKGDRFNDFIAAVKRVFNINRGAAAQALNADLLIEAPEKELKERLDDVRRNIEPLLDGEQYAEAVTLLFSLTDPINEFFDRVLVMDKRDEIRSNRLSLLNKIWETVSEFADFSKFAVNSGQKT